MLAIREGGEIVGSVSGGCIEDDLIARMAAGEFHGTQPFIQRYGVTPDEARRFGLPCGGVVELVIEPAPDMAALDDLARRIAASQLALRSIDLDSGVATVRDGCRRDQLSWDGHCLTTLHGPAWRLLIIGAGQISRYLASMAQALDYQVLICDPRVEYSAGWDVPGAALLAGMPDNAVAELGLDPRSAVVALTHDPKLDDMALLEALKSPAFYVGALGSRANNARRRERLLQRLGNTVHLGAADPQGLQHVGRRLRGFTRSGLQQRQGACMVAFFAQAHAFDGGQGRVRRSHLARLRQVLLGVGLGGLRARHPGGVLDHRCAGQCQMPGHVRRAALGGVLLHLLQGHCAGMLRRGGTLAADALVRQLGSFNLLWAAFHEWLAMARDVWRAPWRHKLSYLWREPGWSHDGSRETTAQIRARWAERQRNPA